MLYFSAKLKKCPMIDLKHLVMEGFLKKNYPASNIDLVDTLLSCDGIQMKLCETFFQKDNVTLKKFK